jgi:transcriptional regulator with XRE-family HTH domain
LIRRNLPLLRDQVGLSQGDLAERARARGLKAWTQATVAAIEGGYRKVSVEEEKVLLTLLEVPLTALLAVEHDEIIEVAGAEVDAATFRSWARGEPTRYKPDPRIPEKERAYLADVARRYGLQDDEAFLERLLLAQLNSVDTKAAQALGVYRKRGSAFEVTCAAWALWGHNVKSERGRRFQKQRREGDPARVMGHITRQLQQELGDEIRKRRRGRRTR